MTSPETDSCGSESGYRLHRYHGTPACDPCLAAHSAYNDATPAWRERYNAQRRERRRLAKAGSHHAGYCLDSGIVVYAERQLSICAAIRRVNLRYQAKKPADPRDEAAVEAWAREHPDQVCRLPFTDCWHEP